MNDLRYALRSLRKNPGFAVVAVITLALGIAANTVIFSAVHTVLLRPLPYDRPEQLRLVQPVLQPTDAPPDTLGWWSYPMYELFQETDHGFSELAAYTPRPRAYNLSGVDAPTRVRVEMVSASYFPLLGVEAAVGRTFLPEENVTPGQAPVALVSHELWQRQYGADSSLVDRTISLNSIPFTVVGVLPPGFAGLSEQAQVWVPMMMAPPLTFANRLRGATSFWHFVVGRTSVGRTEAAQESRLQAAARAVDEQLPLQDAFGDVRLAFASRSLAEARIDPSVRAALTVLMGAVAFVLLIVCVNVANLLLTQTAKRRRELGVKLAIGARRVQIIRQLFIESTTLALLGGAAAVLVALWGLDLLRSLAPTAAWQAVEFSELSLNAPVLVFNFAVAALVGVVIGVLPALRTPERELDAVLKESSRSLASRVGARGVLVSVQVGLALVLLAGAGLMLESLARLRSTPLGFETEGLLTVNVELARQAYPEDEAIRFLDQAARRLSDLPGVERATVGNCLPLAGHCDRVRMEIQGEARGPDEPGHEVWTNMIDGEYFRTLGIPLQAGRTFQPTDRIEAPRVAIINEAAARAYWPDENPIGARIQLSVGWDDWAEVVGVVGDTRISSVAAESRPGVYLPYAQWFYRSNYLVVSTAGDPLAYVDAVRQVVRDLDPNLPIWDVQTMRERVAGAIAPTRFSTTLLALAAGLATLLAAVGVFGVMAFNVAGRTREFGMRMALGATAPDVVRLVVRQGMRFTLAGLAGGLVTALILTRFLTTQLYQVRPTDPLTLGTVSVVLGLVALTAAYLPARRAATIDPVEALREE
ncbi:MAG: ABC transporter permease [Gemmatimonadetes bacterium]|uniref:ABC transporter permease n=1 Tax=Candidatus Kutchimonas denitrificans TaxID=3056748 RepID=A0AAE4Z7C7_9BACT|nr:ABC transporter permease [Gemmatimonadota bacterium]NIR73581.1 ABC transporter permease [Candidatus Kutchimonas denitrificans]NIR99540.1 ABC transporter permease [Gemmatimonadota bacterium]NIT65160.1 ABC transporter permease [Gemmatimonadota bacterium]NIV23693.1 FtsX-like permease family protein [Gemmatimonadota bacterium]